MGMFVIGNECALCGLCAGMCPQSAISMGEVHNEIDQELCIQCGTCIDNCPFGAIEEVD